MSATGQQYGFICRLPFRLFLVFLLLVWNTGIFLPALIQLLPGSTVLLPFLKVPYGAVCHQQVSHSFLIDGIPLLVCARCSGIYIGAFAASLFLLFLPAPKRKLPLKFIFIPAALMLLHVAVSLTGLFDYSRSAAFITGILFGGTLFFFTIHYIIAFVCPDKKKNNHIAGN